MLRLYLVRHGETLSNIRHTLQGWSDTPLTSNGIQQGKNLGLGLSDIPFLKIYSSTSERAYDTACYISENRNLEIKMCKGLKEINFGDLETGSNVFEGCNTFYERLHYPYNLVNGENIDQVCKRLKETITSIVEKNMHLDGNILCISHGIAILAILRMVDEETYQKCIRDEMQLANCSVSIISWDNGQFKIEKINNIEYERKGGRHEENYK